MNEYSKVKDCRTWNDLDFELPLDAEPTVSTFYINNSNIEQYMNNILSILFCNKPPTTTTSSTGYFKIYITNIDLYEKKREKK